MTEPSSPFAGTRFEYENEREHLYYLPPKLFRPLEEAFPTYLIGTRGSGKTTLLKALNWKERTRNRFLVEQLGDKAFENRYIGIYIRCPHIQLGCFERWLESQETNVAAEIISLEIDLTWLKALFEAVAEMVRKGIIANSAEEEAGFVQQLSRKPKIQKCLSAGHQRPPLTLLEFADAFEAARFELESVAKLKAPLKEVVGIFPLDQVGTFGRFVSTLLQEFCDLHEPPAKHWHFKICLDESECLSALALKVVNTAVRLSEWPTFFVVSFVRIPEDVNSTFFEKLTHQKADKHILPLDTMNDDEFRQFAEGVAAVRIRRVNPLFQGGFQLRELLGTININRLLTTLLDESVRAKAKEFISMAEKLKETPFYREAIHNAPVEPDVDAQVETGEFLPIYQAYLIDRLELPLPDPTDPKWMRRNQDSREIRKKMVAAYLSICAELVADVRYASAEMVFQISDGCMRDFLFQMHELFVEAGKTVAAFIESSIPWKIQDAALKRASKAKFESISNRITRAASESARVVEALARLTATLQAKSPGVQHLASSERGRFQIDLAVEPTEKNRDQYELLTEAAEAGFLKILGIDGSKFNFRIHTSLAPHFGCSYRGAYYDTKVSFSDIRRFRDAKTPTQMKEAVVRIAHRVNTGENLDQIQLEGLL